ncbi:MAG: isoleucine--tRNA ligase [bacterium]|nr:isoleucine--tRNA ligase [bacterium]
MMADYRDTIFLPKTSFPMRANLPQREPEILKKWADEDLYKKLRTQSKGRSRFILHDGPPYANGHAHLGHALNRILKDFVVRSRSMMGFDTPFVPGWDCHGLPIEWKIEERYRKEGKKKEDVPTAQFRQDCRDFAGKWIDVQRNELKRLGLVGDWNNPYITMTHENEAAIVQELGKFIENGALYKGFKPVMWSVVEQTALAEAEVEYQDRKSPAIYVRFPIVESSDSDLIGASALIWTTTPWTIPANQAIAFGEDFTYVLVEITEDLNEDPLTQKGDKILIAEDLLSALEQDANIRLKVLKQVPGSSLEGTVAHHPLYGKGYDRTAPFLSGDHVTLEAGTGLVHTAPDHGPDDFVLGQKNGLGVLELVNPNGTFAPQTPLFAGTHIFKADTPVLEALKESNALLAHKDISHSYPHSWRSKAPLIYRTTPQWFLSMDHENLRDKALKAIDGVTWYPKTGQKCMRAMVANRPDWCLSRQRVWGVPLSLFVHKETGELLKDSKVHNRIVEAYKKHGSDIWFQEDPREFLKPDYDPDLYEPVMDILDVWFDSGCSHAYVLENRPELSAPADLYLEGSDQHRGWFQVSLLESCATRGQAPYKAVFTHGFTLDEKGHKMSKSLGNSISPQEVSEKMGAEILRLWVANSDVTEDMRLGKDSLKHHQDSYRRFRNTFRYLLGGLQGFSKSEIVDHDQIPELERWVLSRLASLEVQVKEMYENYRFQALFSTLHNFCALDLSAFYFDVRKDSLYCDAPDDLKRRAARTVFFHLLDTLTRWLAPVLCFTAEEVWQSWGQGEESSVHLSRFKDFPQNWQNKALEEKYDAIRHSRRLLTGAMEEKRTQGLIRSSLQAQVRIFDPEGILVQDVDWAELSISSAITLEKGAIPENAHTLQDIPNLGVLVEKAEGDKCERCWRVLPEVAASRTKDLCNRCDEAVLKVTDDKQSYA